MRSSRSVLAIGALLSMVHGQSIPATASATDLAAENQGYLNSGFGNPSPRGFGINLTAEALFTVEYASGIVSNGVALSPEQTKELPTFYVTPSSSSGGNASYTIMLADASSLGDPDTEGNYRHYLANSFTGSPGSGSNTTFTPSGGDVITNYATPGPLAGTGPHRYAWMLFKQPADFKAPEGYTGNLAPSHWVVSTYVQSANLQLVAATWFTVENGAPTGSVAATSAVNTAALSTSSAATTTKAGASSPVSSGGAAATTSAAKGSAGVVQAGSFLAAIGGIAAFFL